MNEDMIVAWGAITFTVKTIVGIAFALLLLFLDSAAGLDLHDAIIAILQGWAK